MSEILLRQRKLMLPLFTLFIVWLILTAIMWRVISTPGFAWGADVTSYLHTTKFTVDYLRQHGSIPQMDPYWYAGFEHLHNSPPILYLLLGSIYFLSGNIFLTSRLFHLLILVAIATSMFLVINRRWGYWAAAIGAIAYATAPMILWDLSSYTKLVAAIFLPLCFYFTEKTLENRRLSPLILLALFLSLSILSHPMMGGLFAVLLFIYAVIRSLIDREIQSIGVFYVILGLLLGFILSSWYLIPFISEGSGQAALHKQEYIGYSVPFSKFPTYLSFALMFLPPLLLFRARLKSLVALYITSLIGGLFSLGANLFGLLNFPPLNLVYPLTWLHFSSFGFAFILGAGLRFDKLTSKPAQFLKPVIATGFIAIILISANQVVDFGSFRNDWILKNPAEISKKVQSIPNDGRMLPMKYPFGNTFQWIYWLKSTKPNVEGHYYGVARRGKHLSWIYDAINYGYLDYPFIRFKYLNVRFLITNANLTEAAGRKLKEGEEFLRTLPVHGYKLIAKNRDLSLYYKDTPSSYVMPITEKTLVIGEYASTLSAALSHRTPTVQGGSRYLDDYDLNVLKHFDNLVLYGFGFRNKAKAENLVTTYVAQGGRVIIDLTGIKNKTLEKEPSFLGVTGYSKIAREPILLERVGSDQFSAKYFPLTLDLPTEKVDPSQTTQPAKRLKEWGFRTYLGLDEPLVRLGKDKNFSVIGYRKVKGGKVLFVGPNLFYHAFLTHRDKELELLNYMVTGRTYANRRLEASTASNSEISLKQFKPELISFQIETQKPEPVLVSYSFSPHWKAYLDGKEIKVYNIEDLILLSLPKGKHFVEIKYENTPIHYYANSISVLTLLLLGFLVYKEKRRVSTKEEA
jgi:uncharacterized membrane protein